MNVLSYFWHITHHNGMVICLDSSNADSLFGVTSVRIYLKHPHKGQIPRLITVVDLIGLVLYSSTVCCCFRIFDDWMNLPMISMSIQTTWECQGQEPAVEEQQRREFVDLRWHLIRKVDHNEPDSEKWKCFSRTWHKQSCGISHLSWGGCWCVKPAHIWKYKTQCGASWVFFSCCCCSFFNKRGLLSVRTCQD